MRNQGKSKVHCNSCLQETTHQLIATKENFLSGQNQPDMWWSFTNDMLECCGCHAISLRVTERCSEADGKRFTIWPPRVNRREPSWMYELPAPLTRLLQEVYIACAADARALAAMGLRAVIDEVAKDKVGDLGSFHDKLDGLVVGEFISSYQRQILDAALETGHAATHRAFCPPPDLLESLLDITEHLLQGTYILPEVAKKLQQKTPKRPKRL